MPAEVWIDNSLLLVSILVAIVTVRSLRDRSVAFITGFFLIFPSILVFLNMWAHTVAVLVTNYQRYGKGTFQFSFHFYGLLLLGFTGIMVSGLAIHYAKKLARGYRRYKSTLYTVHFILATLFFPVGFINPLGFLPVLAAIVSTVTLRLASRKKALAACRRRVAARIAVPAGAE
ncbi:MAG TPA: hypothetical protein VGE66_08815 [Chitinophagaceae bacterium]